MCFSWSLEREADSVSKHWSFLYTSICCVWTSFISKCQKGKNMSFRTERDELKANKLIASIPGLQGPDAADLDKEKRVHIPQRWCGHGVAPSTCSDSIKASVGVRREVSGPGGRRKPLLPLRPGEAGSGDKAPHLRNLLLSGSLLLYRAYIWIATQLALTRSDKVGLAPLPSLAARLGTWGGENRDGTAIPSSWKPLSGGNEPQGKCSSTSPLLHRCPLPARGQHFYCLSEPFPENSCLPKSQADAINLGFLLTFEPNCTVAQKYSGFMIRVYGDSFIIYGVFFF